VENETKLKTVRHNRKQMIDKDDPIEKSDEMPVGVNKKNVT